MLQIGFTHAAWVVQKKNINRIFHALPKLLCSEKNTLHSPATVLHAESLSKFRIISIIAALPACETGWNILFAPKQDHFGLDYDNHSQNRQIWAIWLCRGRVSCYV